MFFVLEQKKIVKKNKGKITYNLPMGQSKFNYELTFWFISIENGGKQQNKIH